MDNERAWRVATRVAAWVVVGLVVVLAATGIMLAFGYRPDVSDPYANIADLEHHAVWSARGVHRLASTVFVPAAVGLAVASVGLFLARRDRGPITFSVLVAAFALAAQFTGYLLPWDQLALWSVTVGTNMDGYTEILGGDRVKSVLIGSQEIATSTFSRWFWVHAVGLPLLIIGAVAALMFASRRARESI